MAFRLVTKEDDQINYFRYVYLYNNGGVAIGDLDGDGLEDLIFTTYRQGCRVYRNTGGLKFQDVTDTWGIQTGAHWVTGTTIADIDSDGDMDVYFCTSGPYTDEQALKDLVFLNNGQGKFTESAASLGLGHSGNSQSALFADYDSDGDLDLLVLGHRVDFQRSNQVVTDPRFVPYDNETDRLFINDGSGHFMDRTDQAGLRNKGFSLAAGISDLDGNGGIDMYVANDFTDPDRLYMNDGRARFREAHKKHMGHCSYFSMGLDIADINNDAKPDILVVDMTPSSHQLSKENMASMRPDQMKQMLDFGYPFQSMTNSLQLARGNGHFSEIAHVAGVDRTDWSWSPLIFDIDNDGYKDVFISNGIKRDVTNSDFRAWQDSVARAGLLGQIHYTEALAKIPSHVAMNHVYRNKGDLTFSPAEEDWGYHHSSVSTGAAYADLDNDGDIDLVTIDHDEPAKIIENRSVQLGDSAFIQVVLKGSESNPDAIGARVSLYSSNGVQYAERFTVRGFQSSSTGVIHFGLSEVAVDSLVVDWPDGLRSCLRMVEAGKRLTISHVNAERQSVPAVRKSGYFSEIEMGIEIHRENPHDDFADEILLPHKQSQHGPALAVGDVNKDGHVDLLVSGSSVQSPMLYLGSTRGFKRSGASQPWEGLNSEFIGAEFFDADGDADLDLYLAAGSTEFPEGDEAYLDRLYLNNGRGSFTEAMEMLPRITASTQVIEPFDADGDGDLDLFIGGRNVPNGYPLSPLSFLLENDGSGTFSDISEKALYDRQLGMITDAVAQDMDGDGRVDLWLAGEWTSISLMKNNGGTFTKEHDLVMPDQSLTGWWNRLHVVDLDRDGDLDIVAGNLGKNNKFHPSTEKPLKLYLGDMDRSGTQDIVLAKTSDRGEFPVRGRECSSEQMPFIQERFKSFKEFASADIQALYGEELNNSLEFHATEFRSLIFRNNGDSFDAIPLPNSCQLSPVNGIAVLDVNGDGHLDLVLAGNRYGTEVETTPYDAGVGQVLLGDGTMGFKSLSVGKSGFFAPGNVKDLKLAGDRLFVVNNNAALQCFDLAQ